MSSVFFLIFGFLLLFVGGELLVKGSVSLALRMKISTLVVGMTVVSLATSSPELFVSLQAIFNGSSNIALGNVIGSNISNIALVLGFTAIMFRVSISKTTLILNYPALFGSSVILGLVLYFFSGINNISGFLFIVLLIFFLYVLINNSRKDNIFSLKNEKEISNNEENRNVFNSLLFLLFGVVLLTFGSKMLVESAINIAKIFGVSDRFIAVTIVAVGTSIPELSTSMIAAFRKEDNLAVGNLIGSNIFNILAVLGLTACMKEITLADSALLYFDYLWMIIITLTLGVFIYFFSKKQILRREGFILLLLYAFYLYQNFSRVI